VLHNFLLTAPFLFLLFFSDAQIPDGIRPAFTNLAEAAKFWEFWYRGLPGSVLAGHHGQSAGQEVMFEPKKRTTLRRQGDQAWPPLLENLLPFHFFTIKNSARLVQYFLF
jgi:hypothetical protein